MTFAGESAPLDWSHRSRLIGLIAALNQGEGEPQHQPSDVTFSNLFLFRHAHGWRFQDGHWPCLSGFTYDRSPTLIPLFPLQAAPLPVLKAQLGVGMVYAPLSAAQVGHLDPHTFAWEAVRDDADYLYEADRFRTYRGRLLQKKRNLAGQLKADHQVHVRALGPGLVGDCLAVLTAWMQEKGLAPGEADEGPCGEALQNAGQLGLQGEIYLVDGQVAGFLLVERVSPAVHVVRFAKALVQARGLYQHMFQHHCLAHPELQWVNFEQDLGRANFRQTKLSYQPCALIEKFRVHLRA